jgi:hypothetical protein
MQPELNSTQWIQFKMLKSIQKFKLNWTQFFFSFGLNMVKDLNVEVSIELNLVFKIELNSIWYNLIKFHVC